MAVGPISCESVMGLELAQDDATKPGEHCCSPNGAAASQGEAIFDIDGLTECVVAGVLDQISAVLSMRMRCMRMGMDSTSRLSNQGKPTPQPFEPLLAFLGLGVRLRQPT